MVKLFTGTVLALVSLFILNFIIKETSAYKLITSIIGATISLISIGSIPLAIISLIKKNHFSAIGILGAIYLFSKSRIAGILRDSFFKAIIYVLGIWLLERYFGNIANGVSQISLILVAFGPVIIILIGIGFVLLF